MLRLLHTSDWHLGHLCVGRERRREHGAFLDWLLVQIEQTAPHLLIVAGDIFDTGTPPNYALQLYYNFLSRVADTACRQVVILGGNHDSVSTLHAPRELLRALRVHVVAAAEDPPAKEVLAVEDAAGGTVGFLAAVPFLRERDLRTLVPGENDADRARAALAGLRAHYATVRDCAVAQRADSANGALPLVATGHLFTEAARRSGNDAERDLIVGNLGQVPVEVFPPEFDYVALGHLHLPQSVGDGNRIRYAGSPLPLGFSEAGRSKQILLVELVAAGVPPKITSLPVPEFQPLRTLTGSLADIQVGLEKIQAEFADAPQPVWVQADVRLAPEDGVVPHLDAAVAALAEGKNIEILSARNLRAMEERYQAAACSAPTLDELSETQLFARLLADEQVTDPEESVALNAAFQEILHAVRINTDAENGP